MSNASHTSAHHPRSSGAYWFVLHRGTPTNVVWRSPAIRYHRWSEEHRAWVEDNNLFLDTDGPDARRSEHAPVPADEALAWLEANRSYSPDVADRAMTLDAELSADAPAERPSVSVDDAVDALASALRSDPRALREARRDVEALNVVDLGKGKNPWFFDDRRYLEWGVAKIIHDLIDLGDDPTLRIDGEAVLREALALVDG